MSLPSGYKRLEYIQSSGTQYVDTLFNPTQNTQLVLNAAFLGSAGTNVAGVRNNSIDTTNRFGIISFGSASKLGAFFRDSSIKAVTFDNNRHLYDLSKDGLVCDGTSYGGANTGSFSCTYSLTLFAWNNGADGVTCNLCKVYSCQIYDNGTLIRDYIPCQTTAGEIGLWDDVNEVFYGNAGTGTFTAGPEVQKAPSTPTGFAAFALTDTTVKLNWAASDGATGYKMYKNGALLATLTDTSYTDTVELFSGNTYSVTAYNDDGESEAATLTYYAAPENPILHLVTDRTQADVTAGNVKGTYTAVDLNRVGAAMNYVADRLKANGYDPHISPKADWKDGEWVTPTDQAVYLGDLAELRKQFSLLYSTPEVPPRILATGINTNDGLTHTWANDIEKILEDIDLLLTNAEQAWFYSGDLFSGEV